MIHIIFIIVFLTNITFNSQFINWDSLGKLLTNKGVLLKSHRYKLKLNIVNIV